MVITCSQGGRSEETVYYDHLDMVVQLEQDRAGGGEVPPVPDPRPVVVTLLLVVPAECPAGPGIPPAEPRQPRQQPRQLLLAPPLLRRSLQPRPQWW